MNEIKESAAPLSLPTLPVESRENLDKLIVNKGGPTASIQTAGPNRIVSARLEVSGLGYDPETATERSIGAIILVPLSAVLIWWTFRYANFGSVHETSVPPLQGIVGSFALIFLIIGFLLPSTQYKYINLQQRRIVEEKWYFFVKYSRRETPFSDFSRIVVQHVCHPGEGEDTFTGSVGFKPIKLGRIFWVKEFAATKDEMPREPDQFAHELARLTGLPYSGSPATANGGERE